MTSVQAEAWLMTTVQDWLPFFPFTLLWMSFHFHVAFQNPSTIHVFSENIYHQIPTLQPPLRDSRWFACLQTQHNSEWWTCCSAGRRCNYGGRYLCQNWSKKAWIILFMFLRLKGPPKCPYIQANDSYKSLVFTQNTFKNFKQHVSMTKALWPISLWFD